MPDSMIKTYYDNLRQGKLVGLKSEKNGAITFPPAAAGPGADGSPLTPIELSGRGEALFISHSMAPPPNPRFNDLAPYAYGHVKLEEGVFVEGIITGVDIDPANLQKIYEGGPVPVVADILEVEGLPVLAFKLA